MKWIKYQVAQSTNGLETNVFINKKVGYSEANLAIAQAEAYGGVYEIFEDSLQFEEKEPLAIEFGGTGCKSLEGVKEMLGIAGEMSDIALNKQTLGYSKKNLLKVTAATQTIKGITFTVNSDGSVTAKGTNDNTGASIFRISTVKLKKGTYIVSGCPKNGHSDTYRVDLRYGSAYDKILPGIYDIGNSKIFTLTEEMELAYCARIDDSTAYDNLTFYPMIRSADIEDGTYEPYVDDVQTQLNGKANSSHGHNNLLPVSTSNATFTTLADFWTHCESIMNTTNSRIMAGRFALQNFVPGKGWYRCIVSQQNPTGNGGWDVTGSIILDNGQELFYGKVNGGKTNTSDLTVEWFDICNSADILNTLSAVMSNSDTTKIAGANALKDALKVTTATLNKGATSITISDSRITTNSLLSFYTSIYGVSPKTVTVAAGKVTLTFDAQTANMTVGVRVDG